MELDISGFTLVGVIGFICKFICLFLLGTRVYLLRIRALILIFVRN